MRNPENGDGSATPYLIAKAFLFQKYDAIFNQKAVLSFVQSFVQSSMQRSAIIFKYPQGTFLFFQIIFVF